jgi:tetratricopeptide (TPR) repeat protein
LTFEVHRPYFDGAEVSLTAIQARAPVVAEQLFAARQPQAPRFSMVMPVSYRQLLTRESGLREYRVRVPTDLPEPLASPGWARMAEAHRDRERLDSVDRAGLAQWLVAACLPDAVLELAPADLEPAACRDELVALVQYCRATALVQQEGLSERTMAAYRPLVADPAPTVAHLQALGGWAEHLARHAPDGSTAPRHLWRAREVFDLLAPDLSPFDRVIWPARLLQREARHAERHADYDTAWQRLQAAVSLVASASPVTAEQEAVALELRRRLLDRQIEIAVRRKDLDGEAALIAEGLTIDPTCVKIRMQAAQAAERQGEPANALAAYLLAARLGPFGTAFALLGAARCARQLRHMEFARMLDERAFRSAPRSAAARAALLDACEADQDAPMAEVVRRAAQRKGHENNWHYQMYGSYFNLGESHSPCFYACLPSFAYEFAVTGIRPRIGPQRIMPPAFRTNLVKESGLSEFRATHPADLPVSLRTPAWQQLCDWVDAFSDIDLMRQHLVSMLLFRLGFRELVLELVPQLPLAQLRTPLDFHHQNWREIVHYAASAGKERTAPMRSFQMVDHPECPLHLRLTLSVLGVVFVGRETRSVEDAVSWRKRAQGYLEEVLDSDEYTPFEKTMWHSRFYRGVSFAPFLAKNRRQLVADMDRSEELSRAVPANSAWEIFLKAENLHACLESRSKEAFGLGELELAHRRTEEFLALDPYDPKSHIEAAESLAKQDRFREAGDAYLRAARLGPLGTAIAYSMAGECYARAGASTLAEDCFVQSLRVDPYAISAARGWRRVASDDALAAEYATALDQWGRRRRQA